MVQSALDLVMLDFYSMMLFFFFLFTVTKSSGFALSSQIWVTKVINQEMFTIHLLNWKMIEIPLD
jgi:hypothetical protein